MFKVKLKNNKEFNCLESQTIFEAAKQSKILLNHSCLSARCKSCLAKILDGKISEKSQQVVLSENDKLDGFILTCNSIPESNIHLNISDIDSSTFIEKRIFPSKIKSIEFISKDYIILILRIPPNQKFVFNPGQYINLLRNGIKRSYSIADYDFETNQITLFIRNYENGILSNYLFNNAKIDDLIRIEGPLGTFNFQKSHYKNIIFLCTGTGIAPVYSILNFLNDNKNLVEEKKLWLFWGLRKSSDSFIDISFKELNLEFHAVFSRESNLKNKNQHFGYVQNVMFNKDINLKDSQIYACGSDKMINQVQEELYKKKFSTERFFSDSFVESN